MTVIAVTGVMLPKGQSINDVNQNHFYIQQDTQPPGVRAWQNLPPPPGWNRVKVSENLGATAVATIAPVDTSLN